MEIRIQVGNKMWIVPSNAVGGLVAWLNANAVEVGAAKSYNTPVAEGAVDPRQLILEAMLKENGQ